MKFLPRDEQNLRAWQMTRCTIRLAPVGSNLATLYFFTIVELARRKIGGRLRGRQRSLARSRSLMRLRLITWYLPPARSAYSSTANRQSS
jgi:hypothetical protein